MNNLEVLGLNKNESKLYQSLLVLKKAGASDLAKDSGVPLSRVYDYLNSLMEKGFISLFPGKIKQYMPISPE